MKRTVLILTDGKAGHENQSKAFARSLGCGFELCPVRFRSRFHKLLSYALDRFGIRCLRLFRVEGEILRRNFAAVTGAGSGTFYAVKTLAGRLKIPAAAVLYPRGYSLRGFDCVMAPSFDNPRRAPNVVEIPANLVASDGEFYDKGAAEFLKLHAPRKKAVAVIVGGPNRVSTMTAGWMRKELEKIFAENGDVEYWVTTSRRTPKDVEEVVDSFPFDYKLVYSRDKFNPIPAFVRLAKRLYVTAESTGMLSEACTSGSAEVRALDNLAPGKNKFRRFLDGLKAGGYVDGSRKVDLSGQFERARRLLGI
jgi:mitochondrial fission protein ELM1